VLIGMVSPSAGKHKCDNYYKIRNILMLDTIIMYTNMQRMGKTSQRPYGPSDGATPDASKRKLYAVAEVTEVNACEAEDQP